MSRKSSAKTEGLDSESRRLHKHGIKTTTGKPGATPQGYYASIALAAGTATIAICTAV